MMKRQILSYNERVRLQQRKRALESTLRGEHSDIPRHLKAHMQNRYLGDPNVLQTEMKRIDAALQKGSPNDLSKREKQRLERQAQDDRAWLQKHMVPRKYMDNQTYMNRQGIIQRNSPEFRKALQENLKAHSNQFKSRVERYKQSMRALAPDDPEASNIENIRPEK